jgi:hypothetical protein
MYLPMHFVQRTNDNEKGNREVFEELQLAQQSSIWGPDIWQQASETIQISM